LALVLLTAGVQESFDRDVQAGHITRNGWNNSASAMGRLGYKLILQTGEVDRPINMSRVSDRLFGPIQSCVCIL